MIGVVPFLLAVAAAAVYLLPLVMPRPQEPDDIALPPVPRAGPTPQQKVARKLPPLPMVPTPARPDFVSAVKAVDAVVAYLIDSEQYGTVQQQAARVLRAAVVEGATPPVPPGPVAAAEASA